MQGETSLSAYQIYQKHNSNYTKSETEWLDDFISGLFSTTNITDVLNISDLNEALKDERMNVNTDEIMPPV